MAESIVHGNETAARRKVREQGCVVFTWTRTHRYAASCCPVGSVAAFCICLGLLSHSRRVARRSAFSWFRLGPRPTLKLTSERLKRRKIERVMEGRRKAK